MKLLVDIGNTRLKWVQFHQGEFYQSGAIHCRKQSFKESLECAWQDIPTPQGIYLACVGSMKIKQALDNVVKKQWPDQYVEEIQTPAEANGVTNGYLKTSKLGIDRWLGFMGAYHEYKKSICVVSCGTAITLDIVDQSGLHLGGMIMPGLRLMRHALENNTEKLISFSESPLLGLANGTESAISSGNLAAIQGFITFGLAQYKAPIQLLMTGGDACSITEILQLDAMIDTELVFKGLALSSRDLI